MDASSLFLDSRYNGPDGSPRDARGIIMADNNKEQNIYQRQKGVMLFTWGIDKIHSTHTTYKITISIFNMN